MTITYLVVISSGSEKSFSMLRLTADGTTTDYLDFVLAPRIFLSLDNKHFSLADRDLTDFCRKVKRLVDVESARIFRRTREETDELLYNLPRQWNAEDLG